MRKACDRVLRGLGALLAVTAMASVSACVDDSVVDRIVDAGDGLFPTPAESAAGMLGYSDESAKLTVCGNCHVGPQAEWESTDHSGAWGTLQASGSAEGFCEACHTVNELGNPLDASAGYTGTGQSRYHDVQCESCHGPGLEHVTSPGNMNVPLAVVSTGLDNTQGCGECHQGAHHPFVEEWESSGHGFVNPVIAGNPECAGCHEGGAALARLGVGINYLDEGELLPLTCVVCHDPHGSDNPAQLRFPLGNVPVRDNLCARCHERVAVPIPGDPRGLNPHAPASALLAGDAGFFFPGMEIDPGDIVTTHGSAANPQLCARCHVLNTTIADEATGEFVFQATGHGFNAVPCVDGEGVPTDQDCALSTTARTFQACASSGCHTSQDDAATKLTDATTRFSDLVATLEAQLLQVDPNLDAPGGEIDSANRVLTTAEGAFFNMLLARFGGTSRPSPLLAYSAAAAHNPFLVEELLLESIDAVSSAYGVLPSPTVNLSRTLGPASK